MEKEERERQIDREIEREREIDSEIEREPYHGRLVEQQVAVSMHLCPKQNQSTNVRNIINQKQSNPET